MTFIPFGELKVGDEVKSLFELENAFGRFTKGHLFTIIKVGINSYHLEDKDGNVVMGVSRHKVVSLNNKTEIQPEKPWPRR